MRYPMKALHALTSECYERNSFGLSRFVSCAMWEESLVRVLNPSLVKNEQSFPSRGNELPQIENN